VLKLWRVPLAFPNTEGRRLRLDVEEARPTWDDHIAFVKWAAASVAAYVATLAVMFVPALALAAALWSYFAR
jgi:hypothetical protein